MTTFRTEDDVLTLLIHLGYLAYDEMYQTVRIPNSEIRAEYVNTVAVSDWGTVSQALKNSADTLQVIWQGENSRLPWLCSRHTLKLRIFSIMMRMLLVIRYHLHNKKTKIHECMIETQRK